MFLRASDFLREIFSYRSLPKVTNGSAKPQSCEGINMVQCK